MWRWISAVSPFFLCAKILFGPIDCLCKSATVLPNYMKSGNSTMSLRAGEEVRLKRRIVICGEKMRRRADDGAEIMPPSHFLKELWTGKLLD